MPSLPYIKDFAISYSFYLLLRVGNPTHMSKIVKFIEIENRWLTEAGGGGREKGKKRVA